MGRREFNLDEYVAEDSGMDKKGNSFSLGYMIIDGVRVACEGFKRMGSRTWSWMIKDEDED